MPHPFIPYESDQVDYLLASLLDCLIGFHPINPNDVTPTTYDLYDLAATILKPLTDSDRSLLVELCELLVKDHS